MKKCVFVGFLVVCSCIFIGCESTKTDILEERAQDVAVVPTPVKTEPQELLVVDESDLQTRREKTELTDDSVAIRTSMYIEDYPTDNRITNMTEFADFQSLYENVCDKAEFTDVFGTIDDAFFEKYILLAKIETSGNGAQVYYVDGIGEVGGFPVILDYMETESEIGTDDMSTWFLFARIEK